MNPTHRTWGNKQEKRRERATIFLVRFGRPPIGSRVTFEAFTQSREKSSVHFVGSALVSLTHRFTKQMPVALHEHRHDRVIHLVNILGFKYFFRRCWHPLINRPVIDESHSQLIKSINSVRALQHHKTAVVRNVTTL